MKGFLTMIRKYRHILTIFLALIGIGIMAYYDYCDTTCSYLNGDIFGLDLKCVGMPFMAAVIVFIVFKQNAFGRQLGRGSPSVCLSGAKRCLLPVLSCILDNVNFFVYH